MHFPRDFAHLGRLSNAKAWTSSSERWRRRPGGSGSSSRPCKSSTCAALALLSSSHICTRTPIYKVHISPFLLPLVISELHLSFSSLPCVISVARRARARLELFRPRAQRSPRTAARRLQEQHRSHRSAHLSTFAVQHPAHQLICLSALAVARLSSPALLEGLPRSGTAILTGGAVLLLSGFQRATTVAAAAAATQPT